MERSTHQWRMRSRSTHQDERRMYVLVPSLKGEDVGDGGEIRHHDVVSGGVAGRHWSLCVHWQGEQNEKHTREADACASKSGSGQRTKETSGGFWSMAGLIL
ncbi:unnamed protein product [Amoebophrya sp. A25]|nr:unnamed protein product [Amoebophrya sp. A25]|eukprot:GSA25T00020887001.1